MNRRKAPILQLTVSRTVLVARAIVGSTVAGENRGIYESSADLIERVAALASAAGKCKWLVAILDDTVAQKRTLKRLPRVKEAELRSLIAQNAGQFFRRNGTPLVTNAVWLPHEAESVAYAVAVEEPLADAIAAGAKNAGLVLQRITTDGDTPLDLTPPSELVARRRVRRRRLIAFATLAGLLWLTAAGLLAFRLWSETRSIDRQLAAAQSPLEALRELRQDMATAQRMIDTLAVAERRRGVALATLARITAALPDSAVLASFDWRSGGASVITGTGVLSSGVVSALKRRYPPLSPRADSVSTTSTNALSPKFVINLGPSNHD